MNISIFFDDEVEIIIMVTHGYSVQALTQCMEIDYEVYQVEFCETFIFGYNGNTYKLLKDQFNTEHIK